MNKHAENLGRLVKNMQSLEFVLRAFLVNDEIASGHSFTESTELHANLGSIKPRIETTLGQKFGMFTLLYYSTAVHYQDQISG